MTRKRLHRFQSRDLNEPEIIAEFKDRGCFVYSLTGEDLPDLLIGHQGHWALVEVKAEGLGLKPGQQDFKDLCRGRSLQWYLADHIDDVPQILVAMEHRNA